jgi:hypothetical protein
MSYAYKEENGNLIFVLSIPLKRVREAALKNAGRMAKGQEATKVALQIESERVLTAAINELVDKAGKRKPETA